MIISFIVWQDLFVERFVGSIELEGVDFERFSDQLYSWFRPVCPFIMFLITKNKEVFILDMLTRLTLDRWS